MLELYRTIIPSNYIINDNHGTHYKIHMNCLSFLTRQFERIINNEEDTPGNFKMPSLKEISNFLNCDIIKDEKEGKEYLNIDNYPIISIRCEVWRPTNRLFDPQNYAKTFKAPIDLLVMDNYIVDDNWKYINGITYVGGGPEAWENRAFRYKNDGLPDILTPEWWNKYSENYGDIFIRIIIDKD